MGFLTEDFPEVYNYCSTYNPIIQKHPKNKLRIGKLEKMEITLLIIISQMQPDFCSNNLNNEK